MPSPNRALPSAFSVDASHSPNVLKSGPFTLLASPVTRVKGQAAAAATSPHTAPRPETGTLSQTHQRKGSIHSLGHRTSHGSAAASPRTAIVVSPRLDIGGIPSHPHTHRSLFSQTSTLSHSSEDVGSPPVTDPRVLSPAAGPSPLVTPAASLVIGPTRATSFAAHPHPLGRERSGSRGSLFVNTPMAPGGTSNPPLHILHHASTKDYTIPQPLLRAAHTHLHFWRLQLLFMDSNRTHSHLAFFVQIASTSFAFFETQISFLSNIYASPYIEGQ